MTTTNITTHQPRIAEPTDVHTVSGVLASAFFDDPVFTWCLPDPDRRAEVLPAFFGLVTAAVMPHREVQLTPGAAAAALWVPPGHPPVPAEATDGFEARVGEILGSDGDRTFAIMELLDAHHPVDPHRFLWFLGVRPEHQRRGIGSALLRPVLAACDRQGVAAYLDATSEENRRLYERHGFDVVSEHSVDGSPPLWGMWRPASPARDAPV